MREINLYIVITAHGPKKQDGAYGWVLESIRENGEPDPRTKSGIGIRENTIDRDLALEAVAESLGHLNTECLVHIHLDPAYMAKTFPTFWDNGWVSRWEENGWRTAKGDEVKNAHLWKNCLSALRGNSVVYARPSDGNPYKAWILSEINRALRGKINDSGISRKSETAENGDSPKTYA